jgi:hypothetical protein
MRVGRYLFSLPFTPTDPLRFRFFGLRRVVPVGYRTLLSGLRTAKLLDHQGLRATIRAVKDALPHLKVLEEIEQAGIPVLMEVLREEGLDGVRYALWDATG